MAKSIIVSKEKLQETITEIETSQKPNNRSQLWQLLEESEWAKTLSPRPLSGQTAMLRAKEWNLNFITPVGKRGIQKGEERKFIGGGKRKTIPLDIISTIRAVVPEKFQKKVNRLATGSMKAAIALKCLDCTCYQPKEIRLCDIKACALYPFRPYK